MYTCGPKASGGSTNVRPPSRGLEIIPIQRYHESRAHLQHPVYAKNPTRCVMHIAKPVLWLGFSSENARQVKKRQATSLLALELTEHVLELTSDEVLDLLGELGDLVCKLVTLGVDLLASDLGLSLNLLEHGRGASNFVATLLDDGGVVGLSATVPGEDVGGVAGDVGQSTHGGDGDEVSLQLLGGDIRNSEGRVLGRLEREKVGEKTSNVRRSHRGTGDGVDGVLAADPGRLDVETRGEDVVALAVVGEVGTLVSKSAGTNGDSLVSGSGRVVARVGVIVACGNSEVDTSIDSSVDSLVEDGRFATAQAHVGSRALEALSLALLGDADLLEMRLGGVLNTLDDVGHGARAVGAEDLDGLDVCLLGHTVLLAGDGARAVCSVSVAVLICITLRDGLAPRRTTLKVDVLSVGAGVDDVDIDALATVLSVEVLVEGAEAQAVTVGDTGEAPGCVLLDLRLRAENVNLLVSLNELDL
jgi:hypothetical protein